MREPLGTIYWGQASNGLSAGVTIHRPVVDEKKLGSPPYMPSVVLLYKLRNVGDRPILLVSPFYADGMSDGELRFAHSSIFKRLPEPREMPGPSFVVELLPGGELSEEFDYRIPERPHRMVVRFDYHNYARQVVVRGDGEPAIVGDLWTGHLESGVLESRID